MTLTTRLSLFFLAALATVLATFSVALYLLAHRHLHRQLDDRLAASAHTLAAAAEVEPDGVEWEPHNRPLTLAPGAFGEQLHWTVADDAGRVIDRSPQPGVEELVSEADGGFRAGHRNPRARGPRRARVAGDATAAGTHSRADRIAKAGEAPGAGSDRGSAARSGPRHPARPGGGPCRPDPRGSHRRAGREPRGVPAGAGPGCSHG